MSAYLDGSRCEDCFSFGMQNFLKPFYINLDEQIIKCESSTCMFPYIKRSECSTLIDLKPRECSSNTDLKTSDCLISLDEFIEESAKRIDSSPVKSEPKINIQSVERIPIMFDFSSIFMENPVQTKAHGTPSKLAKDSLSFGSSKNSTSILSGKSSTHEDSKKTISIKNEPSLQKTPPKARISRCLANVKSSSISKKFNPKRCKPKRGENTVFVIDPQSGKTMRPLDLIKHYIGTKI